MSNIGHKVGCSQLSWVKVNSEATRVQHETPMVAMIHARSLASWRKREVVTMQMRSWKENGRKDNIKFEDEHLK